jgi:putative PIN family toxin of toxin-antitoxin system
MLEDEGKIDHIQLKTLIAGIASFVKAAEIVHPRRKISLCRDAEDNMLLECCLEAKADFLITGNSDLLDLEDLPFHLKILTPREFIEKKG